MLLGPTMGSTCLLAAAAAKSACWGYFAWARKAPTRLPPEVASATPFACTYLGRVALHFLLALLLRLVCNMHVRARMIIDGRPHTRRSTITTLASQIAGLGGSFSRHQMHRQPGSSSFALAAAHRSPPRRRSSCASRYSAHVFGGRAWLMQLVTFISPCACVVFAVLAAGARVQERACLL